MTRWILARDSLIRAYGGLIRVRIDEYCALSHNIRTAKGKMLASEDMCTSSDECITQSAFSFAIFRSNEVYKCVSYGEGVQPAKRRGPYMSGYARLY